MKLKKEGNYTDYKNIWIIAEVENSSSGIVAGDINPVTHEIAGRGRLLADSRGSELWIIIAGDLNGRKNYKDDFFYADRIIIADEKRLSGFHDETESALINRMISKYRPEIVLFSATVRGRSLAPRIAVLSDSGLTADCTSLDIEEKTGNLLQTPSRIRREYNCNN